MMIPVIVNDTLHKSQAMGAAKTDRSGILLNGTELADGTHEHHPSTQLNLAVMKGGNNIEPSPATLTAPNDSAGQRYCDVGAEKSSMAMTPRSAEEAQGKRRSISSRGPSEPPKWSPRSRRGYHQTPPA
jgi:hypothetical protein